MHGVAETERAENWELEKELEQLELFLHHSSSSCPAPGDDLHPFPSQRDAHTRQDPVAGEALLDKRRG